MLYIRFGKDFRMKAEEFKIRYTEKIKQLAMATPAGCNMVVNDNNGVPETLANMAYELIMEMKNESR